MSEEESVQRLDLIRFLLKSPAGCHGNLSRMRSRKTNVPSPAAAALINWSLKWLWQVMKGDDRWRVPGWVKPSWYGGDSGILGEWNWIAYWI